MNRKSKKPGKNRKWKDNSPLHRRKKELKVPLDRAKYGRSGARRIPIRAGDTVRVVRGNRSGHEGKVAEVDLKKRRISVEKALLQKADNKEVAVWFDPSNTVITKLDLSDAVRKERFKHLSED